MGSNDEDVLSWREEGGCILIFITGVTCEENEIEDRLFRMLFSLILSVKMTSNFSLLIFFLVPTLRPGSAAAFC